MFGLDKAILNSCKKYDVVNIDSVPYSNKMDDIINDVYGHTSVNNQRKRFYSLVWGRMLYLKKEGYLK